MRLIFLVKVIYDIVIAKICIDKRILSFFIIRDTTDTLWLTQNNIYKGVVYQQMVKEKAPKTVPHMVLLV